MSVVIETTLGDITVDLYLDERPNACLNFLKLCKIKYYNLCIFHKVERNFIAQTGDPTCTGRGGESVFCHLYGEQAKYFDAELKPRLKHQKLGTLSMVNNGNGMNGSQFFITLGENLTYLDEVHTVFGEVAEGFETLLKINEAICDANNRPYQDIRITHTVVLHDPYEDPKGLTIPDASPEPTKEQLESNYIGADEEIDDTKGKSMEEIEEKIKESEAKARATILEMVGDIPDAEVKPPENVLFVCKLNPVTTSEDLEIIFSRFGPIKSCEVIKDKKTSDSLQYAFIEFENEEDCENAYFKMDNVLIDDRRIHVDFSQSVSKLNWNTNKKDFQQSKKDKFVIKESKKKSDGYDMIFDTNDKSMEVTEKPKMSNKSDIFKRKHKYSDSKKDKDEYKFLNQNDRYREERLSTSSSSNRKSIKNVYDSHLSRKEMDSVNKYKKRPNKSHTTRKSSSSSSSESTDSSGSPKRERYKKNSRHRSSPLNDNASECDNSSNEKSTKRVYHSKSPSFKKVANSSHHKRHHSRSRSRSFDRTAKNKKRDDSYYHNKYDRHSRSTSPKHGSKKVRSKEFSPHSYKNKEKQTSSKFYSSYRASLSPDERIASNSRQEKHSSSHNYEKYSKTYESSYSKSHKRRDDKKKHKHKNYE